MARFLIVLLLTGTAEAAYIPSTPVAPTPQPTFAYTPPTPVPTATLVPTATPIPTGTTHTYTMCPNPACTPCTIETTNGIVTGGTC